MVRPVRLSVVGQDKTAAAFASVNKQIGALKSAAVSVAGLLGVTFGAQAVRNQIQYADALGKTARQLGGNVEFLSEAAAAAKLAGVETRTLTTGLQRMVRRIAEAAGGGREFAKAFDELNLNARTLKDADLETQFEAILDALAAVNNEADRVKIAQKIFDSEGVTIARLAGEFKNLRVEAQAAGSTITTEFATQAAVINDNVTVAIERLNQALRGSVSFVFQLADGLGRIAARLVTGLDPDVAKQLAENVARVKDELEGARARVVAFSAAGPAGLRLFGAELTRAQGDVRRLEEELRSAQAALEDFQRAEQRAGDTTITPPAVDLDALVGRTTQTAGGPVTLPDMVIGPPSEWRDAATGATVIVEELESRVIESSRRQTTALERNFGRWLENTEGGFRGLAESFAATLRRMVADALASRLFGLFFNGTLGVIPFGGERALGGPVTAGTGYVVGERGPELFVPRVSGRIEPNRSAGGAVIVNNTVNAQGADKALIEALPALLERNRQQTRAEIVSLIRQRRMP